MQSTARQVHEITTSEVRIISVDFTRKLDAGEVLTGTPTVTAPSGSGVTISSEQINSEIVEINSLDVAIGKAVQFSVDASGGTSGTYNIDIVCGTDASQTVHGRIRLRVING